MGFTPWPRNPAFCNRCLPGIAARGLGGAEVELSMIFADVRGSTSIAETMAPTEFAGMLQRFYAISAETLVRHDARVDAYIGDEVTALFIPAFAGPNHAEDAIAAGRDLLRALGNGTTEGAWIPVGVAIHTGNAYVGAVGAEGKFMDVKALGDSVNTAARLASSAAAGEMLVSDAAAEAGTLNTAGLEHRDLTLKGKLYVIGAFVAHA
jgi:adenylate cyclase